MEPVRDRGRRTGAAADRLRTAWDVLRNAVTAARANDVTTVARALAYSLFLAIPAAMLIAVGLFSLLADASTISNLVERVRPVLPDEATTLLQDSLRRSAAAPRGGLLATLGGLALALWTTTSAATTLMSGLTRAHDGTDERGFVRQRAVAIAIVACLGLAGLLVLGLLVLGPHLERWVAGALGADAVVTWVWWTAQWPVLILALLGAFSVLLYLGPDVEQPRWRFVTPGAVVALVVWLVASGGFALYAARFGSYERSWGTLSAVIVTLVWLWLTSAALLLGAEVDGEVRRRSSRVPTADDATTTDDRPSREPRGGASVVG